MENTRKAASEATELTMRRREQDLECLTLLKEAHRLRLESEFLDGMFAALRDGDDPELTAVLKNIDRELDF